VRPGKHRSLEHPDEEAQRIQLVDVGDSALGESHNTPEDFQAWEQPPSPVQMTRLLLVGC